MCLHSVISFIPFYFDIQHDHVLKKLNFDFFLPPPPGSFSFVLNMIFCIRRGRLCFFFRSFNIYFIKK